MQSALLYHSRLHVVGACTATAVEIIVFAAEPLIIVVMPTKARAYAGADYRRQPDTGS